MIIFVCFAVLAIGIAALVLSEDREWVINTGISLTTIGVFFLVVIIIGVLVGPFGDRRNIAGFNETRATVEAARANPSISAIELAAIQQKVVEMNQWLAGVQYTRKNPWVGIFNAPEVMDIKPIR
jgi:type VI protein secretion system component VasK